MCGIVCVFGCNHLLLDGWPLQISAPEGKRLATLIIGEPSIALPHHSPVFSVNKVQLHMESPKLARVCLQVAWHRMASGRIVISESLESVCTWAKCGGVVSHKNLHTC
jgi:hypothetical protein